MTPLFKPREKWLPRDRAMWRGARVLCIDVDVSHDAPRPLIPSSLRLAPRPRGMLVFAEYPDATACPPYLEFGLVVEARYLGFQVLHCPWMVVDHDAPMLLGRELLGFPKKLASFELTRSGDVLRARVSRRATKLLDMRAELRGDAPPRAMYGRALVNVRGNPGLVPPVLWQCRSHETILAARHARVDLMSLGESQWDALGRLVTSHDPNARYLELDIDMPSPRPWQLRLRTGRAVGLVSPYWFFKTYRYRVL